jgi:divinyl protochlorophyllide a 8-vinyl-reductase
MPDGAFEAPVETEARIGPNAILQLAAPVEELLGPAVMAQLLGLCRVPLPTGLEMIPEESVARVHRVLWQHFPEQAREVSERAGRGTAQYIRRNRIPGAARMALRVVPRSLGERQLTRAIVDHAWTFCGSGRLTVTRQDRDIHFELEDNPLADSRNPPCHPCHWHAAVFEELFSSVLGGRYQCAETSCRGCGGALCRFVLRRGGNRSHFKGLEV